MYYGSLLFLIPLFLAAFLYMLTVGKLEEIFAVFMTMFLSFMAVMPIAYRMAVSYTLKHRKPASNSTVVVFVNGVPVGAAKGNRPALLTVFLVIVLSAAVVIALYVITFLLHKITKNSMQGKFTKWIQLIAAVLACLDAVYIVAISAFFRKPVINATFRKMLSIRTKYGWTGFQPVTGMVYGAIILIFAIIAVVHAIKAER
ncbi:MAG: hypothetical protein J5845_03250 [Lachnospiraceae bacterium]|nr:hypothetical protein [Lachnospiraceae bacterium]